MTGFPRRYVVGVGLGANLGDREATLRSAVSSIESLAVRGAPIRVSALYETEPVGPPQPRYLNAAIRVGVALHPHALLDALLSIEAAHGRLRGEKWGPRTLDLDVLVAVEWRGAASLSFRSERLVVPHPQLLERAFALAPLLDVLPALRARLGPVLASLGDRPSIVRGASRGGAPSPWSTRATRTTP